MSSKDALVQFEVDYELYKEYEDVLSSLGINLGGRNAGKKEVSREIFEQGIARFIMRHKNGNKIKTI